MVKQFFQFWLPSPQQISHLKFLRIFGKRTLDPRLWYVNRKSVTKAVLIGSFFGLLPVPLHSVFIVAAILFFEVNLPIGLAMAWLTNPLTLAPILYIAFWIGSHIFHVHMITKPMLLGVLHQICRWFKNFGHGHIDLSLAKILVTGLFIEALITACFLYVITNIFWRLNVCYHWNKRKSNSI